MQESCEISINRFDAIFLSFKCVQKIQPHHQLIALPILCN
jgi:hypothetical protein